MDIGHVTKIHSLICSSYFGVKLTAYRLAVNEHIYKQSNTIIIVYWTKDSIVVNFNQMLLQLSLKNSKFSAQL
jgi:hypothetical protein